MTSLIAASHGASSFSFDAGLGRDLIGLTWAAERKQRGTVIFSHGALSAPWKYRPLISFWQHAGFEVWAPLHVDSSDHPLAADYPGLATWPARLEDVRALCALLDRPHIAAGHSYGALTALALGGARPDEPDGIADAWRSSDPSDLTHCVVALSPPPAIPGLMSKDGYRALARPAFIQTGTRDEMPGWHDPQADWRLHLDAWHACESGGERYLLVLDGVDHTFGGLICEPEMAETAQTVQLEAACSLIGSFMTAYSDPRDTAERADLHAWLSPAGPSRFEFK